MNKIFLIIQREYLTRVKKKSFLIMTLIGPLLMALLMIVPTWLASNVKEKQQVIIVDEQNLFDNQKITEYTDFIEFQYSTQDLQTVKKLYPEMNYDGLLHIPKLDFDNPSGVQYFSEKSAGIELKNKIERIIETKINNIKYSEAQIDVKKTWGAKDKHRS